MEHVPNRRFTTTTQKAIIPADVKKLKACRLISPSGKHPSQRKLVRSANIPNTSGIRTSQSNDPRRLTNSAIRKETRSRKKRMSECASQFLLWNEGAEGRQLSWDTLQGQARTSTGTA